MAADGSELSLLNQHGEEIAIPPMPASLRSVSLRKFIVDNRKIFLSLLCGVACTLVVFAFTWWLSGQTFKCPDWAVECSVNERVKWIQRNLGLVQGLASAIFSIGLGALAFATYRFSETTTWLVLQQQPLSFKEIDSYLSASRGSIASLPSAYKSSRCVEAAVTLVCLTITILTTLSGSPLVGYAYTRTNVSVAYTAEYTTGKGPGFAFKQEAPPAEVPGAVSVAFSHYASWANGFSAEPMEEQRDFLIDRLSLSVIGNFSVYAMRAEKRIDCAPRSIKIEDDGRSILKVLDVYHAPNNRTEVRIRMEPFLTVWVSGIKHHSETQTTIRLVFAVLNGTIEGGFHTPPTEGMLSRKNKRLVNGISSLACDVNVKLVDDELRVGDGGGASAPNVPATSIDTLTLPSGKNATHADSADWLGIAPSLFGLSVRGAQPVFLRRPSQGPVLPVMYTSRSVPSSQHWQIEELKHFIRVSSGAMALAFFRAKENPTTVRIPCRQFSQKLKGSRSFVLLIPPVVLLVVALFLAGWSSWKNSKDGMLQMQLAGVSEVVKSSQTGYIHKLLLKDNLYLRQEDIKYGFESTRGVFGFVQPIS